MANFVNLKNFQSLEEAEVVKSMLEANGIVAMIKSDDAGGMRPAMTMAFGVLVLVLEKDLKLAEKLIIPRD